MNATGNKANERPGENPGSITHFEFGAYRLDVAARTLWRGRDVVQLPSRAYDTLLYLIRHRDRLIHKNELIEQAWNDVVVTDSSLMHAISVLRRALSDDPNHSKFIRTVPRRGYKFVGNVTAVAAPGDGVNAHDESASVPPVVAARASSIALPLLGAAAFLVATAVAAVYLWPIAQTASTAHGLQRFQPSPPGTSIVSGGALSPDGRYLAFAARTDGDGGTRLWLRVLSSSELRPLDGTEGASKPFWAPDSRHVGFFANGKMMVVAAGGGAAKTVVDNVGASAAGGTWGPQGTILFADWAHGLYAVSAEGGAVAKVATVDREWHDIAYAWPQFLPDGRHFLYHVTSLDPGRTGAYVGDLDTSRSVRLVATDSPAVFAEAGWLLHVREGILIADEVDLHDIKLTGRGKLLARNVVAPSLSDENSISAAGPLVAFIRELQGRTLVWVDRSGAKLSALSMPMTLSNPRLSPDQSTLLATGSVTSGADLWLAGVQRAEFKRLEPDATAPLWAPDGQHIAFTAGNGIYVRSLAVPAGEPIVTATDVKVLNDWSPDGTHIVYTQLSEHSKLDLWQVRLRDRVATPLLATSSNEMQARFSPSGQWLTYVSDDSGVANVYVADYPGLSERHIVSATGGGQPQWGPEGRELFYMAPDRSIVAVEVTATREGLVLGAHRRLFRAPFSGAPNDARDLYVAAPDGMTFLIDSTESEDDRNPVITVVNWAATEEPRRGPSWRELIAAIIPQRPEHLQTSSRAAYAASHTPSRP